MENWYEIADIDQLDSPALVVYPHRVKENILALIELVGSTKRIRPHVKTNKSPHAVKFMLNAGINQFKCSTIAEAEMLAQVGARDVLLAYQPVGPKISRFIQLIKTYPNTQFSCITDEIHAAKKLAIAFFSEHLTLNLYIDLNIGMNRTGILPGEDAAHLYRECAGLTGVHPVGLHAYDGHIRQADINERKIACDESFSGVLSTRKILIDMGYPEPEIIIGGTPSLSIHAKRANVICSPGTFIYWDKGYQEICPELPFKSAALVVSRVISIPGPTKVCLDLGHKSISAENELKKRVYFLNGPHFEPLSQSEEHLVVDVGGRHNYLPGEVFYGIPWHVCPTVALYERATTIVEGHINGQWSNVSRDRTINI